MFQVPGNPCSLFARGPCVLATSPISGIKCLARNLRKERFILACSSKGRSPSWQGKAWWQEQGAAPDLPSTIRKQRVTRKTVPGNPLPPAWLHLLKALQPSPTSPLAGTMFKCMTLWRSFHIPSSAHCLSQKPRPTPEAPEALARSASRLLRGGREKTLHANRKGELYDADRGAVNGGVPRGKQHPPLGVLKPLQTQPFLGRMAQSTLWC